MSSENPSGADNQQGSRHAPPMECRLTPQRLHAGLLVFGATGLEAYLQGALKDGTFNVQHNTHRIGQADRDWLVTIGMVLDTLGHRSWIYREGANRRYWILETSAPFLSTRFDPSPLVGDPAGLAYARGYFDAEGSMPCRLDARLYFYYAQKSNRDLQILRRILTSWDIACGSIHNPSRRVDPNYWRFYIRTASHQRFIQLVGSSHPRKLPKMHNRMKI